MQVKITNNTNNNTNKSPNIERKQEVSNNDSIPELLLDSEVLVSPTESPRMKVFVDIEKEDGSIIEKVMVLGETKVEVGMKIDSNTENIVIENFEQLCSVVNQLKILDEKESSWCGTNPCMPQICCIDMKSLNVTVEVKGLIQVLTRLAPVSLLKVGDIEGDIGRLNLGECWRLSQFECGNIKKGVFLDCSKVSTLQKLKAGKIGGTLVLPLFGMHFTHNGIQETGKVLFGTQYK